MAALFAHEALDALERDSGILFLWSTDELVKLGHRQSVISNPSFHEAKRLLKAVNRHSSDPNWLRDLQEPLSSTRFEKESQDIRQAVLRILRGVQHFTGQYCEKNPEEGKYPVEELPDSGTVLIQAAHELLYEEKHNIVHGHLGETGKLPDLA
ncbi:hypothetical protein Rhopal_006518-T1 [Rhodotorula paludigena]|uniref:Uncharacterized protein n=1 Tax=Rhodotorula paludigena TaxID=86838 RepID=A0AAV5GVD5_9BASI|nr:hypothetical protein Rhopal_006518-T1 [Rhodotorula paludigena]